MRSKGPPPKPQPQPQAPAGSGGVPGPALPGGGDPPAGDGQPGSGDRPLPPPGLPLQAPGGPPGDGGDSGGDSRGDEGATPQDTDQDFYDKQHCRPPEDPDSSGDDGGKGRRYRGQTPMTINKRAKPLPKLELPPRVHLQEASKVKQMWELWSVGVASAMSTWNDVAVAFWHQVYHQSEESYQDWRRSCMTGRFAYEKRCLYGRKAPVPAMCDSVEALLRHELHLPEWLSRKAGVLGCTSSPTILLMCWKEIFLNDDATRFDLVDELYTLPAKLPTSMFQFAAWLEDWMTKLVAADEVSAHIDPDVPWQSS